MAPEQDPSADFRLRLAGWRDGKQIPLDEDIALYQRLESPFVEWRDQLEQYDYPTTKYLSPMQLVAIGDFRENGGHVSRLPKETIERTIRHGVLLFLEKKVREDLHIAFGSVSALSAAPYSGERPEIAPDHRRITKEYELNPVWPNFDLRDIAFPLQDMLYDEHPHTLCISRSSIHAMFRREIVTDEEKKALWETSLGESQFIHQGYAARAKAQVQAIARMFGNTYLTFNVGSLPTKQEAYGTTFNDFLNQASRHHNKSMTFKAWRMKYQTHLLPEKGISIHWLAHLNSLRGSLQRLFAHEGPLVRRGWNTKEMMRSAAQTKELIEDDIRTGRHAPWGSIS